MEIKSFPNNSGVFVGAEEVMRWHHGRTSGVFAAGNNCAVSAAQGAMAVTVADGTGWISNSNKDGIVWWNSTEKDSGTPLLLDVDPASGTENRIDRVIVEWSTGTYAELPQIKILKGVPASSPNPAAPPALTNNNSKRQISLARILVNAGTLALSSGMITDERLNPSVCGIVTESVTADTSMIQAQFETLLQNVANELADLEAGTAAELKKLGFFNTTVPVSAFVSNATYEDYPYRAAIALTGVTNTMIPEVMFGLADAVEGNFAPISETYMGGVYIYAADIPEAAITIPTIICWR